MTHENAAHRDRIIARFSREFAAKYDKGQKEHGGNMWEKPGMLAHAIEEMLDLAAYLYTLDEQIAPGASLPPVCYIAGPFRAANSWEQEANIRRAEALALEVWRKGYAAICPHTNTRHFQGAADDSVWLTGDLAILARCDVVIMTPDWERSAGARAEHAYAKDHGIRIAYALEDLDAA